MPDKPKFSALQTWVGSSPKVKTNGDRLRLPSQLDGRGRRSDVKVAQFFVLVALLFVLADHLGRVQEGTNANFGLHSMSLVNLILYSPEKSGNSSGLTLRFRLTNKENHSVFYPTSPTMSVPVGQPVVRASWTSDWMSLSSTSEQRVPAVENFTDSNLSWIDMPPDGWVDGGS